MVTRREFIATSSAIAATGALTANAADAPARSMLGSDQWDGYPASRRQVLDQLAAEGIDDTVILTGDIHTAWAMDIAIDPLGGGYDRSTGRGSLAVELVTTSVTSPGPRGAAPDLEARERQIVAERPHIHYVNLRKHGYLLVDLTAERAQAEWWLVDSITERTPGERRGTAFMTVRGANHLQPVEA